VRQVALATGYKRRRGRRAGGLASDYYLGSIQVWWEMNEVGKRKVGKAEHKVDGHGYDGVGVGVAQHFSATPSWTISSHLAVRPEYEPLLSSTSQRRTVLWLREPRVSAECAG
jgi:hypothetical protein